MVHKLFILPLVFDPSQCRDNGGAAAKCWVDPLRKP